MFGNAGLGIKVQVVPSRTRDQRKKQSLYIREVEPEQYRLLQEYWRIRRIQFHGSHGKQDSGTWVSERMQWVMVR